MNQLFTEQAFTPCESANIPQATSRVKYPNW